MPQYKFGDIVQVQKLLDPNRQNPKDRPALIVTTDDDIATGDPITILAISTSHIPRVLPPSYILLPWHHDGHPRTGLNERSVVKCGWIDTVSASRILYKRGTAPGNVLNMVAEFLANQSR